MRKTGLPDRSGGSGDDPEGWYAEAAQEGGSSQGEVEDQRAQVWVGQGGVGRRGTSSISLTMTAKGKSDCVEFKQVCIFLGLDKEEGFRFRGGVRHGQQIRHWDDLLE